MEKDREEQYRKNRKEIEERLKISNKIKRMWVGLQEYLKERWGIVLVHLIISIVAFSAYQLESFFGLYIVAVIVYETYIFKLEKKAKHYEKLFYRTND